MAWFRSTGKWVVGVAAALLFIPAIAAPAQAVPLPSQECTRSAPASAGETVALTDRDSYTQDQTYGGIHFTITGIASGESVAAALDGGEPIENAGYSQDGLVCGSVGWGDNRLIYNFGTQPLPVGDHTLTFTRAGDTEPVASTTFTVTPGGGPVPVRFDFNGPRIEQSQTTGSLTVNVANLQPKDDYLLMMDGDILGASDGGGSIADAQGRSEFTLIHHGDGGSSAQRALLAVHDPLPAVVDSGAPFPLGDYDILLIERGKQPGTAHLRFTVVPDVNAQDGAGASTSASDGAGAGADAQSATPSASAASTPNATSQGPTRSVPAPASVPPASPVPQAQERTGGPGAAPIIIAIVGAAVLLAAVALGITTAVQRRRQQPPNT